MKKFLNNTFIINAAVIGVCFFLGMIFYVATNNCIDFSRLENNTPEKPSLILDDDGEEFLRFELDKRQDVCYENISPLIIKAFIAAEDHNFFQHWGVSLKGIVRSFLMNLYHGRFVQGASTITQQFVRLLFLTNERSIKRKLTEVIMAFQLERQCTKEQIMEMYLNNVYFGRGIYGVQAACRRFWDKSVTDVSLDEAATLAAVAKSAFFYSPLNAPLMAEQRRNVILKSMSILGFITKKQRRGAASNELTIRDVVPGNPIRLYIQEWLRVWAEQKWGKEALYENGLTIKTTLNGSIQKKAENVFAQKIQQLRSTFGAEINGGLLSLEPSTGKIRALIGGIDFNESQFNRAFQAVRQIGSAFKPFVYAAALESGLSMRSTGTDEPIEVELPNGEIWKPRNWNNVFDGSMTLLRALTLSNNIITAKTLLGIGPEVVIDLAKRCGLSRQLLPYPSLSLGIAEATVEENAAAFNVFANNGIYVKPYVVEWVKDRWGVKIWRAQTVKRKALDSDVASKMTHALSWRMKRIERFKLAHEHIKAESIGKTGSTNGSATTWFVGSTPELTTAVYVGRDDNKPLGAHVFGSQTTFPIWYDFYKQLTWNKKHFYYDPSLREVAINWVTGENDKGSSPDVASILE